MFVDGSMTKQQDILKGVLKLEQYGRMYQLISFAQFVA